MAKRRMIHTKISLSEQVNDMSEFAQLLFTWMIPHTDDFGRLSGEPRVVKALVLPMSERSATEIEKAIDEMLEAKLIAWYTSDSGRVIQILKFEEHQSGLHKRTKSEYPPPPGAEEQLDASEADVEDIICTALDDGTLTISDEPLVQVERQYRIGNRYLDILCHDNGGQLYIIEVKRQKLSAANMNQLLRYAALVKEQGHERPSLILVGYGLSHTFDLEDAASQGINVITFDDSLEWCQLASIDVEYRWVEQKRTEENPIEKNSAKRKRDTRLDHPAITGYRELARLHVPIALRDDWITCAEEVGDEYLLGIVKEWIARGYKPNNVKGMMEVAKGGWKHGRSTSPRRGEAGELSDADKEYFKQLEAGED